VRTRLDVGTGASRGDVDAVGTGCDGAAWWDV